MLVSSNGALFGEPGQDRCAVCPCAMPTYIGLLKLQARRQRSCSHVLRSMRCFNASGQSRRSHSSCPCPASARFCARLVTTDPRGRTAWCSPTALSDSNRPVRQNRRCGHAVPPKHAGCDSAPQELPSRTRLSRFTRDCRDCNFGPKMSQNAMYRPYIAMIASQAISWRPRPILARPRMVPDTPRCALHAGGVSLTRLGRPEKSTFWWPRRVVRAAPRLVPQASF